MIQAVVGEEMGMRPLQLTFFRDFLDGLSNSILIIEVPAAEAVIWSKPSDVEIDLNDPIAKLKGTPDGGFYVGMGDGSVSLLTDQIEPVLLRALLTRAGKERIDPIE